METSRFFVANLPTNTKEKDLQKLFRDYGEVENIELKIKENLVDPTDIKIIAFVTLNIGADDAKFCLNDLNLQKVNGKNIKVSLAKESFMERLKRERKEANATSDGTLPSTAQSMELPSDLLKFPNENKRKTFDVTAELDDDDVAHELITKKRAAGSMHNGKIVIQSRDVEPIHIIETKHKKKLLNNNSNSADQRRKESINKKKSQHQQNKSVIQQALLKSLDNSASSKKIKFSDAESDNEEQHDEPAIKLKINFFGSDDEYDEDVQFKLLPTGKKGEKLVQMQAKQSLDPRFHIDAKFVDDDDDEKEQNDNEVEDERQWQMNILEQVVGTKFDAVKSIEKSQKNKKMLHYDPSKDEHKKFERLLEDGNKLKKSKQKQTKTKETATAKTADAPAEVSKEVFYVVTDTLQQSLRTRGEGFSLLNMFSNSEQMEQRDEQLKQLGNEKILVNTNKLEKSFNVNTFSYDSSPESDAEQESTAHQKQENVEPKVGEKSNAQTKQKSKKNLKIATESFFIPKTDIRFKEGSKFFIYRRKDEAATENYEEVRNRLKMLIKTKITKTKKNLVNAGHKGKNKF